MPGHIKFDSFAQFADFSLYITDGDVNHVPSSEELQHGYTRTDPSLTLRALELLAKEIMKSAEGRRIKKGESENTVLALRCLLSQGTQNW